jgi:hypothetical protein
MQSRQPSQVRRLRRPLIVIAIAALLGVTLLLGAAHLDQVKASYWQGRATPCGALHFAAGRLITATDEADAAEACFARAASRCQAASLTFSIMGVDTGTAVTLLVEPSLPPSSGCTLVDIADAYNASLRSATTTTYTCAGVTLTSDGLRVSGCAHEGNFTLPATHGEPVSN